jgi:ABC-2 type transport system permease protein
MKNQSIRTKLRIIGAIATKDVVGALRNSSAVGVLLSVLFVIVMYRYLPILTAKQDLPLIALYDAGDSTLVPLLENNPNVETRVYTTEEDMKERLTHQDTPALGMVIPVDFDRALAAGRPRALTGYVMAWVGETAAADLQQTIEGELAADLGVAVPIHLSESRVYATPTSGGLSVSVGLSLVFSIVMMGLTLPPYLILEEKRSKTLDALLVSPATVSEVMLGKALCGLTYAMLGAALGFLLNRAVIVHGWLAITTATTGALFSIGLGLLLGVLLETRQQFMIWAWFLLIPMMLPMMLFLMDDLVPAVAVRIFTWIPTTLQLNLYRAAFSGSLTAADWAAPLAVLASFAVAALGASAWAIRMKAGQA